MSQPPSSFLQIIEELRDRLKTLSEKEPAPENESEEHSERGLKTPARPEIPGVKTAAQWPFTIGAYLLQLDTASTEAANRHPVPAELESATQDIKEAFDGNHYRRQIQPMGIEVKFAYLHYYLAGWKAGLSPHPLFDTAWYLLTYPDIGRTFTEPFSHYLTIGWREGRQPNAFFDGDFYYSQIEDLTDEKLCPLLHYARGGWKSGYDPGPWFSGRKYLANNPDVAARGIEPLAHYLLHGRHAGRTI